MDFLGLIRVVDLALCDDIYLKLAESMISSKSDHQPLTVVRIARKGCSDKVHSRFDSCQSFFPGVEISAIKSWS